MNLFFNIDLGNFFELSFLLDDNSLLYLIDNLRFSDEFVLLYYFFYYLGNWLNLYTLSVDINRYSFFKINRDWTLNRLIYYFFNNLDFFLFIRYCYDLINMHLNWNLVSLNDYSLFLDLLDLYISAGFNVLDHDLIRRHLYWTIYCNIYDLLALDLLWNFDVHVLRNVMNFRWHVNRYLHHLFNYFLNNLRNLHNLLNNSWHNDYFLHNLLDFNKFRHFN